MNPQNPHNKASHLMSVIPVFLQDRRWRSEDSCKLAAWLACHMQVEVGDLYLKLTSDLHMRPVVPIPTITHTPHKIVFKIVSCSVRP